LEEKKKYKTLLVLSIVLVLVCVMQGFLLLRDSDFTFSWRKEKDNDFDAFSQSLLDEYKQNKSDAISIQTEEEEDRVVINVNVPNLRENNLNVTVDTSGVHIEAEVEQVVEKKDSEGNIISSSKVHRKRNQTFPLPHNTDYEKAQMEYKENKVIITIPKLPCKKE